MSKVFEVPAEVREDRGKGASRRLRRTGMVPGIVYGANRDARPVQVEQRFLLHAMKEESFYTSILELAVKDGRRQKVILRDLQRHPFKPELLHIDFQRISDTENLRISVPIHFVNEEKSPAGKASGVVISHQVNEVEISCLPKNLPEYLELDLSEMDVGTIYHLSDIRLPEGVEIIALAHDEEDATVVTAQHITVSVPEPDEVEETSAEVPTVAEDEDGEGEQGDEGDQQD